jgi:outer membrane protein assembly factor BamE (lipoprotein component of BamABCDE complex)
MRNRIGLLAASLLPVMLLSGCVMGRVYRDHPLDEIKISGIQRGVTTKQEILDLFGPPQEIDARELTAVGIPFEPFISRRGDKPPVERIVAARFFRYTYTRANAMALILVLFNYGEFDQKSDNLVVFFDGDNKVEDFAFRKDTDQLPRFGFWSR